MDQTFALPNAPAPQPVLPGTGRATGASSAGAGAISGGLLRPGAIDQPQFRAMLQAAQSAQQAGPQPAIPPDPASGPAPAFDGIPTLTPAQFAVLTGGQAVATPDPAAVLPGDPAAVPTVISGRAPAAAGEATAAAEAPPAAEAPAEAPTVADAAAEKTAGDPRVVHFKHLPDQDERKALSASGKRWVVDETPGSRKLFFGDDEVFGWDDFVDLINPLQHIPVVAQVYRAVSGDQINGAAELLGALPFGPSGTMAAVMDLMVRDTTGRDIGSNAIALLFGTDQTPDGTAVASAAAAPPDIVRTSAINMDRDNGGHDA